MERSGATPEQHSAAQQAAEADWPRLAFRAADAARQGDANSLAATLGGLDRFRGAPTSSGPSFSEPPCRHRHPSFVVPYFIMT